MYNTPRGYKVGTQQLEIRTYSKIIRCIITPRGCDKVRQNKPLQHISSPTYM